MPRKRAPSAKLHDIVAIHLLDHCRDGDDALPFVVYGRVSKRTRTAFTVDSWANEDPEAERQDDNIDQFTIVRSAIVSIEILQKAKPYVQPCSTS